MFPSNSIQVCRHKYISIAHMRCSKFQSYSERFSAMKACKDSYYIIVVEDVRLGQIVGSGSLVVEQKFIHSTGQVGSLVVTKLNRTQNVYFFSARSNRRYRST